MATHDSKILAHLLKCVSGDVTPRRRILTTADVVYFGSSSLLDNV